MHRCKLNVLAIRQISDFRSRPRQEMGLDLILALGLL